MAKPGTQWPIIESCLVIGPQPNKVLREFCGISVARMGAALVYYRKRGRIQLRSDGKWELIDAALTPSPSGEA